MTTKHSIKLIAVAAATLSMAAIGCNKNPEVEALEERFEHAEEAIERSEEATKEAVEGIVESKNAAHGEGEIRQEIEGLKARDAVDEEYDKIEEAHEAELERRKEALTEDED